MKFISLLIFFTLLNTSYSIIPYLSYCPNGHYCPTIKYGAISENSQPKSPGWTLSFIGVSTIGEAMSVYPDVDTYKGHFSVTGDGSAPMSVQIKLGCTNKLIGKYSNKMSFNFGFNWDDICITSSLPIAVNRALDVNDFTLENVTSNREPVEKAIYSQMLNHTKSIGCHPGEWFELISCNIIDVTHGDDLTDMYKSKALAKEKLVLLELEHQNKVKEQNTLSYIANSENDRTVEKAKADTRASSIKNNEALENKKKLNKEEREHLNWLSDNLGTQFESTMWSQAIGGGNNVVALPFGNNGNQVGINVHNHNDK